MFWAKLLLNVSFYSVQHWLAAATEAPALLASSEQILLFPPSHPKSPVYFLLHPIVFLLFFGVSNLEKPLFLFSLNVLRTLCIK